MNRRDARIDVYKRQPGFRADFRESLYRMITALTGVGVTILSTVEMNESFTEFPFSTYSISFLTDDIIRLRYVLSLIHI